MFDSQPASKTANHKQSFRLRNLTVVRNEDVLFLIGKAPVLHQLMGIAPLSRVGDMIFDAGKTHYWEFFQLCVSQAKPQFQRSRQKQVSYIFINWNIFFQPEDYDKTTLEKLLHSELRRGDFGKGPEDTSLCNKAPKTPRCVTAFPESTCHNLQAGKRYSS